MFCPECHTSQTQWIVACGKGSVYTFAVFHRSFHQAFEGDLPYVTAIVELEEGPHLLTNIIGCPPDQIHCGMPVEVTWEDVSKEFSLPKFMPTPSTR